MDATHTCVCVCWSHITGRFITHQSQRSVVIFRFLDQGEVFLLWISEGITKMTTFYFTDWKTQPGTTRSLLNNAEMESCSQYTPQPRSLWENLKINLQLKTLRIHSNGHEGRTSHAGVPLLPNHHTGHTLERRASSGPVGSHPGEQTLVFLYLWRLIFTSV